MVTILLLAQPQLIGRSSTLYITSYGAACDDSTDDTAAIQNTIDAASSGDTIVFPSGSCRYSDNIYVSGKSDLMLVGAGIYSTTLKATDPDHSAIRIQYSSDIIVDDLTVYSLNTTGRSGSPDADGFYVFDNVGVNFHYVRVMNTSAAGIHIDGSTYVGVYDSQLIDTWADGVHVAGDAAGQNYSVTISNNYAENTGDDSFSCVGYNYRNQFVGFYSNTSINSASSGVTVEGCEYVEVHSNLIEGSAYAGIRVGSGGSGPNQYTAEVDVRWNGLYYLSPVSGLPSILVFADGGNEDTFYIHVRNNYIEDSQAPSAVKVYGASGQTVHTSEVQDNTVIDNISATSDCINVSSGTSSIYVAGNTLNLGGCS
jgi:hypothetical protein